MATTRKQMFLEKINDSSFSAPVPVTVEEEILDGMSGGGGEGGAVDMVYFYIENDAMKCSKTYAELKVIADKNGAHNNYTPLIVISNAGNGTFASYAYMYCLDATETSDIQILTLTLQDRQSAGAEILKNIYTISADETIQFEYKRLAIQGSWT